MWPMWQAVFWIGLLFIAVLSVTGFKAVRDRRFLEPGAVPAPEQKELLLAEGEGLLRLRFRPRSSPLSLLTLSGVVVGVVGVLSWLGGVPPLGVAGLVFLAMIFAAQGTSAALEERWTLLDLSQGFVVGPDVGQVELSRFRRVRLELAGYGARSIRWRVSLVGDAEVPVFYSDTLLPALFVAQKLSKILTFPLEKPEP